MTDEKTPQEKREEWLAAEHRRPIVRERREGWEVNTAACLYDAGEIDIAGRTFQVDGVEPQTGFVDLQVSEGEATFWCELSHSEASGYAVSMRSNEVEVPDGE